MHLTIPLLYALCSMLFTVTAGGINIYNNGVTILLNNVELINPPINTKASGEINGDFSSTSGTIPPIAVIEVSKMGRNLVSAPVSYTHLDVYKRQPLRLDIIE